MVVRTAPALRALVTRILAAAGASNENAATVADHLVSSNLSGVDTHGIWNLPGYVAGMRAGDILPTARPAVLRENPASVLVTGNWGFGHVAARFAMRLAIEKARAQQLAAAGIVQVHMMAVEYLGRILTGADAYTDPARGGATFRHQGVSMLVLRADLFRPLADFTRQAAKMGHRVRAVPPAPGVTEVLVPGDPESRTRATRLRDGIPIPEDTWRSVEEVAASLGIADI
jgi:LDH2 family malate/lactate/ureidoglycolate dehydrogenase